MEAFSSLPESVQITLAITVPVCVLIAFLGAIALPGLKIRWGKDE